MSGVLTSARERKNRSKSSELNDNINAGNSRIESACRYNVSLKKIERSGKPQLIKICLTSNNSDW